MSDYFLLLVAAGVVPFVVSFWPPLRFWSHGRALFVSLATTFVVFVAWDVIAVHRGHWAFRSDRVAPLSWAGLPLDELAFFVVIPFCCIFTWAAVNFIYDRRRAR